MIVCSCNVLSDHAIQSVVATAREQTLNVVQVYTCLGCRMRCGRCVRAVKRVIDDAVKTCPARGNEPAFHVRTFPLVYEKRDKR